MPKARLSADELRALEQRLDDALADRKARRALLSERSRKGAATRAHSAVVRDILIRERRGA